jgi:hypothetical protein
MGDDPITSVIWLRLIAVVIQTSRLLDSSAALGEKNINRKIDGARLIARPYAIVIGTRRAI